ncbi:MAG TPA: fimbrial protein [Rhizobiaceae bacterium]
MARPTLNDEQEKPLDPAVENVRRKLVRFVAINLGLLFIALMAVVGALVYKSTTATTPPAGEAGMEAPSPAGVVEGQIPLPSGAKIVSQSLSGNRLSLSLEMPGGVRAIYIYDIASRRTVGRFAVVEE